MLGVRCQAKRSGIRTHCTCNVAFVLVKRNAVARHQISEALADFWVCERAVCFIDVTIDYNEWCVILLPRGLLFRVSGGIGRNTPRSGEPT